MEGYTTAKISSSAVRHNVRLLKSRLGAGVKFCPAVKANCYGHGIEFVLPSLAFADCMAVADSSEAIELRNAGWSKDILVFFSPCAHGREQSTREALEELIVANVTVTVIAPDDVEQVAQAAKRINRHASVHLKIDSGMHRSGILAQRSSEMVHLLVKNSSVALTGMYTHFATADEADKTYALEQLKRFKDAANCCPRQGLILHAANSAALIDLPQSHLDMVRPGIAIYGYQPSDELHNKLPLRPAMRVMSRLMQVKDVPAGSSAGYNLTWKFDKPARLGLVPIGYADGYLRCFSNRACMRIGDDYLPVVGRVCMDQTILDVTSAPHARVGDAVEVISDDPAAPNSVENLSKLAGTIPHEIICRLGRRIRRVARVDNET